MTRLDQNIPLTQLNENIPMTRLNENIPMARPTEFSGNEKGHVPDNPDPEPSSSDSLAKKLSLGSTSKKKKRDYNKKHRNTGKTTHQTHLQAMVLTCPMTWITDASDIKRRVIG